jgi:hypothetical protein
VRAVNYPPQQPAPGWYPDPSGTGQRYWDGERWTDHHQAGLPPTAEPYAPAAPVAVKPAPALWWLVPPLVALLVVGSVGKWVDSKIPFVDANGLDKDGALVLPLGVIAAVLLVLWRQQGRRWQAGVATCLAAICGVIAIADVSDVNGNASELASVGWGLWLTLVASWLLALLGLICWIAQRRVPG